MKQVLNFVLLVLSSDGCLPFLFYILYILNVLCLPNILCLSSNFQILNLPNCSPGFIKLEELNLSGTNITDDCLRSGKLNSLRALCKLNLSRTTISDGYSRLQLPSLTHLNLDWTQASEECQSLLNGKVCYVVNKHAFAAILAVPMRDALFLFDVISFLI